MASPLSGVVYVTPIEPTLMEWGAPIIILVVVSLIVFWPTIYALIKRRWSRALVYFGLTLPVVWVVLNAHNWWGPTDPENDFGPLKNGLYYSVFTWPVLTAILWTITAVSDAVLAPEKTRTEQ